MIQVGGNHEYIGGFSTSEGYVMIHVGELIELRMAENLKIWCVCLECDGGKNSKYKNENFLSSDTFR